MSDVVAPAAPAAAPVTAEAPKNSESSENSELDTEAEAALDASEEESDGKEVDSKEEKPKAKAKAEKELEKRIKKLKLKVDGKDIEESIDLDDEENLIRQLQMAKMGSKRAQEKADLEKELTSFFKAIQDDPFSILQKELGMNPDQIIEQYINKQIEQAQKSPEQREREQMEAELKSIREEREREKNESQARELERLQQQEFERYDMLMDKALTASDLPKSPYVVKKIADYMLVALQSGYDISPEDVIPLVRDEMHGDLKEMFQSLPEEVVEGLLGEQVLNKLRKRRVAKAQESQKKLPAGGKVQDTGGKSAKVEAPKAKVSYKDFFKV